MNTRKASLVLADRVWRAFLLVAFLGGMVVQPTATVHAIGPTLIVHPDEDTVEAISWQQYTTVVANVERASMPIGMPVEGFVTELIDGIPYVLLDFSGNVDIQPGDRIFAFDDLGENGNWMQGTTVTDVAIVGYDLDDDTVHGTAAPGSGVAVNAWNGPDPAHEPMTCGFQRSTAANPSGEWSVDLGDSGDPYENCDLTAGVWVTADQLEPDGLPPFDADGDWTRVIMELTGASGSLPAFTVRPNEDVVEALAWPMGALLDLEVDSDPAESNGPECTAYDAEVTETADWDPWPTYLRFELAGSCDIQAGALVSLTDDTTTKTTVVTNLEITDYDLVLDTVTGTAQEGTAVLVYACDDSGCPERAMTADDEDSWTADFFGEVDIQGWTWLDSYQPDADEDGTAFGLQVPNPRIAVRPNDDWVEAYEWPMGASVTLEIDDSGIPGSPDYMETRTVTDMDPGNPAITYVTFAPRDHDFDVLEGQDVTMYDGSTTKLHTITGIHITGYDLDADTFSGVATADGPVHANVCDSLGCINRELMADGSGDWTAYFSDSDPDTVDYDILPGTWMDSHEYDDDGDETAWGTEVPRPRIEVRANDNMVEAHRWLEGHALHLEIFDSAGPGQILLYEEGQTVGTPNPGEDTYVRFDLEIAPDSFFDVFPGYEVVITDLDTLYSKSLVVTGLEITGWDLVANTVSGSAAIASPGINVHVNACNAGGPGGCADRDVVADETSGAWTVDFTGDWDIMRGTWMDSHESDDDGDTTSYGTTVPNPKIEVRANDNTVEGFEWDMGAFLDLGIDADPEAMDGPEYTENHVQVTGYDPGDPSRTYVRFEVTSFDILPDYEVSVTDGAITKILRVSGLEITSWDLTANTVSGSATIASPGTNVHVNVCEAGGPGGCANRDVVADESSGEWAVDFTGDWDITNGTWMDSHESDSDGDTTSYGTHVPSLPSPYFSVRVNRDTVEAFAWPMGASVQLDIDNPSNGPGIDYTEIHTVTEWDPGVPGQTFLEFSPAAFSFDILPGFLVFVHDGTTLKEHIVTGLEITGYDLDDDTYTGPATPGANVHANVCDDSGCVNRDLVADGGVWTADFSDSDPGTTDFDITFGTWMDSHEGDDDGDETAFGTNALPLPTMRALPEADQVSGYDWPAGLVYLGINTDADPDMEATFSALSAIEVGNEPHTIVEFDLGVFDLEPGHILTMTQGSIIKELSVSSVHLTSTDAYHDTLDGLAEPGAEIDVVANCASSCEGRRIVTAQAGGEWTADFTTTPVPPEEGNPDLSHGSLGRMRVFDADGDWTMVAWQLYRPLFMLNMTEFGWENLNAWNWPLGATVTLTVDDPDTGLSPDYTETQVMEEGNNGSHFSVAWFIQAHEYPGQPGDVITLSDGYQIKSMVAPKLGVTGFDLLNDTISGQSDPLRYVVVTAGPMDEERTVRADGDGDWTADFSLASGPGETVYDLQPGDRTEPQTYDADWDHAVLRDTFLIEPTVSGNAGAPGVELAYDDGGPQSVTAEPDGDYVITIPFNWSGTVTPSLVGHNFSPLSRTYSDVRSDKPDEDYSSELITYTLSYSAGAHGSISGEQLQYVDYGNDGTQVTADAATGYHFVEWSDLSTENPRTDLNVTDDISVTAAFAIDTFTLTYAAGEHGSITGDTSQTVDYGGDGTQVTADAATGYHFVEWSDLSTENPRTDLNVTDDISVTASFTIDTFTLTYAAGDHGSITGDTSQTVDYGGDGTQVTAEAATGYHFVQWSDLSTENPRTDLNVTDDISVTASFTIDTFTLTYAAGDHGSITGDASQTVDYGGDGTQVTADAATGYHFVQWSDLSTENPRTDLNVTDDISVTASFAIDTFTLIYAAGEHGSITGDTSQTVDYGGDGTQVTAVPALGYHFVQWSDLSTENPRTDLNVTDDISVTASFTIDTFTLTYAAGDHGSITGDTLQTVDYGGDGTQVTAVPALGYHFVQWSDLSTENPRTDLNVTDDISVTASFTIDTFTLTYAAGDHGSITGDTLQTVDYGGDGTQVTAVPALGYHFVQWSDLSTENPRTDLNVTDDISVTASFVINTYTLTLVSAHGTITPDVAPPYHYGDTVHLDVAADPGWIFTNWSSDASGTADPLTVVMNADKTITANYMSSGSVFADLPVPGKEWMEPWVVAFYNAGITTGCGSNPLRYCPENPVTRASMAVFVLRAIEGPSYVPPASAHIFSDLPVAGKEWMEPWVNEFYARGITTGCGANPLRYCPENPVTRAAMAVFLLRALEGSSYVPPPATHTFSDLPVTGKEWMEPWVDEFYTRGITTGCGASPLRYCPENPVTRAAMAVFIDRAYHLYP